MKTNQKIAGVGAFIGAFSMLGCAATQDETAVSSVKSATAIPAQCEITDKSFSFPESWLRTSMQGTNIDLPGVFYTRDASGTRFGFIEDGDTLMTQDVGNPDFEANPDADKVGGCLTNRTAANAHGDVGAMNFVRLGSNQYVIVFGTLANYVVGPRNPCNGRMYAAIGTIISENSNVTACLDAYLSRAYPNNRFDRIENSTEYLVPINLDSPGAPVPGGAPGSSGTPSSTCTFVVDGAGNIVGCE